MIYVPREDLIPPDAVNNNQVVEVLGKVERHDFSLEEPKRERFDTPGVPGAPNPNVPGKGGPVVPGMPKGPQGGRPGVPK